ncbi:MAG: hypothetical protein KDI63_15910 [Gammaproteobacteria bacterium]|nr:hypothetical protein [Gammaproteobacteria bacterium]
MTTTKITILLLLAVFIGDAGAQQDEAQVRLEEVTNFAVVARMAAAKRTPILLLVSQAHCGFCTQIKEQILGPMILSGDYDNTLLIRELFIDYGSRVRDFQENDVDSGSFALRYQVYLTPTLLFIGPDGKELTERLVGIQTPELFFFYVESAVEKAIASLRTRS